MRSLREPGQARCARDVGERAVPVIAKEGVSDGCLPPASHDEEVEPPVVVVIGLGYVQTAQLVRQTCDDYAFHRLFTALHNFCAVDLSAFYFDTRKDALYCDGPGSLRRRACRTVLDRLFSCLTAWLAPICCFTAEEAWWARGSGPQESVHLRLFPNLPAAWRDETLGQRWNRLRDLRRVVTGAIELERAAKRIGSSLQAHPVVYAPAAYGEAIAGLDLAELAITSGATLRIEAVPAGAFTLPDVADVGVVVGLADGGKCERCWRVLPEVSLPESSHLCRRCAEVVR